MIETVDVCKLSETPFCLAGLHKNGLLTALNYFMRGKREPLLIKLLSRAESLNLSVLHSGPSLIPRRETFYTNPKA